MCSSGVRYQCGQPNVNLRKEAEKNERILQEAESCIKQISELCIKVILNLRKHSNYAGLGQMHSVTFMQSSENSSKRRTLIKLSVKSCFKPY